MDSLPVRQSPPEQPDLRPEGSQSYLFRDLPGDETFSLANILALLNRRRWTVLLGFVAVFGLVVVLTLRQDPSYESSATFLVEQRRGQDASALSVLDRVGQLKSIETEVQLLSSSRVLSPVVRKQSMHVSLTLPDRATGLSEIFPDFEAPPEAVPGSYRLVAERDGAVTAVDTYREVEVVRAEPGEWLNFAGLRLLLPERLPVGDLVLHVTPFDRAVDQVKGRITASQTQRNAELIRLSCSGRTPDAAYDLCRSVADSYLDLRSELQRAEASTAAEFLVEQVHQAEARLRAAEDTLQTYERRYGAVALQSQAHEEVRQHVGLRAQRAQLVAERDALASLMAHIESEDGPSASYRELAAFPPFMQNRNPSVSNLLNTLVELENRRSELALRRTEQNPDLAAIDARIAQVEGQLESMTRRYQQGLEGQIGSLDAALASAGQDLARLPGTQIDVARLQRQVQLLEDQYTFLHTRLREAEVAQAVTLPSVRIVDHASYPHSASGPATRRNLVLGLMAALSFGLLLGFVREYTDTKFHGRKELERRAGIPVIATVPRFRRSWTQSVRKLARRSNGGELAKIDPSHWAALEAFRSLAVELHFTADRGGSHPLRTLAITSSVRGEGKTFISSNLAMTRARLGANVLLVDADLRAAGVSSYFGIGPDEPGLRDVLVGNIDYRTVVKRGLIYDEERLSVLPAGSPTLRSAELLSSRKFDRLLARLGEDFDLVVIDTPPLNLVADAAVIGARVDGILVVVRTGVTEKEGLETMLDRLERADTGIVGIVLNDVDLPRKYRQYGYGYGHVAEESVEEEAAHVE